MAFKAIAHELQCRGHRVTFFQAAELAPKFPDADGFGFVPLPGHGFSVEAYVELVSRQHGVSIRNFLDYAKKSATMLCEEAPRALRARGRRSLRPASTAAPRPRRAASSPAADAAPQA